MAAGDITADRAEASDMYGASFDGVDDYVEIPHDASQLGANLSNGFTISAWINAGSSGESQSRILDKSTGTLGQNGFKFYFATNQIAFGLNAGTTKASAVVVDYKSWKHTLITISSAQLANFYVNGALSGAANQDLVQPISAITTTNAPRIGNRTGSTENTFDGCIKDVKMWNRVLTTDEIAADYAGYNSPRNGLILDVPLREDYNDKALGLTGTNSGTYLLNTLQNKIKTDVDSLNLTLATDRIIALPRKGSPVIIGADRAA